MTCPYCDSGQLVQVTPKKDRVKSMDVNAGSTTIGNVGVKVDLWKNPNPSTHTYCKSCDKSYTVTDLTSEYIIKNIKVDDENKVKRIANLIHFYYPDQNVTLTTLILEHCTGIVRPYRTKIPYITNNFLCKKLHVCFAQNYQRTYLALTKKSTKIDNNVVEYYNCDSLVMSI